MAQAAKDINWVLSPTTSPMKLFVEKKIDAFLGTPPEPQELRARKIGHELVAGASLRAVGAGALVDAVVGVRGEEVARANEVGTEVGNGGESEEGVLGAALS